MFRPASLLRPRAALALAATAAAALTAACDDGPLGPNTSARPAAAAAPRAAGGVQTPVPALIRAKVVVASNTNLKNLVPGTAVRFTTDKGSVLVTDNLNPDGLGDLDPAVGSYGVYLPFGSTHYKAEVVSVPIGYQLLKTAVSGKITGSGSDMAVAFSTLFAPPKQQVQINFLSLQKAPARGATVAVTAPGLDLQYIITDGGAGDLRVDGSQGAADGRITVYAPWSGITQWKVCETAAPTGYLTAEPACQTVSMPSGAAQTATVTFFHQTGIVVPPPSM